MAQKQFSAFQIGIHFSIEKPIRNTSNLMVASRETMEEIHKQNDETIEALKEKHHTGDPGQAIQLEIKEREKNWVPSDEAMAYIQTLNDTYQGKKIKFYYGDPMLFYSGIDDPDCNHIPVYEVLCESIELVDTETRKLPMIITKNKNYSLIDMVDITILPSPLTTTDQLHQLETILSDNQFDSINKDLIFKQCFNETWFSNMLAWLLDPKGSHGLGVTFAKEFLKTVAITRTDGSAHDKYARQENLLKFGKAGAGRSPTGFSLKNASVLREFYLTKTIGKSDTRGPRYCDIVFLNLNSSDGLFVVIENKLFTTNYPGQLASYYQSVQDKFGRAKVLEYVYLTLHGSSPVHFKDESDKILKHWVCLSWTDDILGILTCLHNAGKHNQDLLKLKHLLEWLKNLRQQVSDAYVDDLRSLLLQATSECLLEELQRICGKGIWSFSREAGKSIVINHSSSSKRPMYIELLPNLSVTVQSRRGSGKALFEKIILPYGINTDQIYNLIDITARDIYHLYFQRGTDYLSGNKRCTKTRSEKKKHWEPVFDFLYHHHNELKILFTLSQYVWNAQKIELQSSGLDE